MAAKKQAATVLSKGLGLRIARANLQSLGRDVSSALQRAFGLAYVRPTVRDKGSYDLYYFTINPPMYVKSDEKILPCLPGLISAGIWMVVEIRVGREGDRKIGEQFLEHMSIKAFKGPTSDAAALLFRAEWDARDGGLSHAQPHWNIHSEAWEPQPAEALFSEYVVAQAEPGFEDWLTPQSEAIHVDVPDFQHHKIHFALGSNWQVKRGTHSSTLTNVGDAVRWIEGCCSYIKSQFDFLASRK